MSEEHRITTDEKVKNPDRVAAGKRLAPISKEAKAGVKNHVLPRLSSKF